MQEEARTLACGPLPSSRRTLPPATRPSPVAFIAKTNLKASNGAPRRAKRLRPAPVKPIRMERKDERANPLCVGAELPRRLHRRDLVAFEFMKRNSGVP